MSFGFVSNFSLANVSMSRPSDSTRRRRHGRQGRDRHDTTELYILAVLGRRREANKIRISDSEGQRTNILKLDLRGHSFPGADLAGM